MVVKNIFNKFPDVEVIRMKFISLALLDYIFMPGLSTRAYIYRSDWAPDQEAGLRTNGAGDHMWMLFCKGEVFIKGFDSTSLTGRYYNRNRIAWPGLLDGLPEFLPCEDFRKEPAFEFDRASFVMWNIGLGWGYAPTDVVLSDCGIINMFDLILGDEHTYMRWAEENFEREDISISTVKEIFQFKPLTKHMAFSLNPELDYASALKEIARIGYPLG